MDHGRLEYSIKAGSRWPMFFVFTVTGALFVIVIIQPMGPVLGIGTISIFLLILAFLLIRAVKSSINYPRSIVLSDSGIEYRTRRKEYRIGWDEVTAAMELHVAAPRTSGFRQITLITEKGPEIDLGEPMLRSANGRPPQENYVQARAFIADRLPADRLVLMK